jgi:hypothetical protein
MYACFDGHVEIGMDETPKGFRKRSLGVFESAVMFKKRPDEDEPKSAPNVDSYGGRIDAFYFNGPYVVPYGYSDAVMEGKRYFALKEIGNEGLTPLLWSMDRNGARKVEAAITLAAQELPGGGYAVASTNHIDTPFEIQLEAYRAQLAMARRFMGKNPPVRRYPEKKYEEDVEFLGKMEDIGRRIYPSTEHSRALADTVFEDVLGLRGRARQ